MRDLRTLNAEFLALRAALLNPDYDLLADNWSIIEDVKHLVEEYNAQCSGHRWNGNGLVELLLLRVRNKSRHVYAITVGMFPGYEKLDEQWSKEGMIDSNGYTWLRPW